MIDQHWPFWMGGIFIGVTAVLLTILTGKFLGAAKGYMTFISLFSKHPAFDLEKSGRPLGWRGVFLIGVFSGGLLATFTPFSSGWPGSFDYGYFDKIWGDRMEVKIPVLIVGGIMWGFGARLAAGCVTGNSISAMGKGGVGAMVATVFFMIGAIATTYLINYVAGTL